MYIDLESEYKCVELRRDKRAMEADGKIVPRSMAYTHDGKLPSIPDKLSTILEECRREVTPRRAHVSSKTDNLPGIKGNVEPLQIESANSSGLAVEKNDETRPSEASTN